MISTSVFTAAALALASNLFTQQAQAIVIPRDDFQIDIVEVITCTPLEGYAGKLIMTNTANTAANGDATLPDAGVPLGLFNKALLENTGAEQDFQFQNCTSSFMALPPADGVVYGHISPTTNSSQCLSVYPSQPTPQPILQDICSMSDDSGQMLLFWKLTVNAADPTAPATIDFVGRSTQLGPDGIYLTDFTGTEGNRSALMEHTTDTSRTSSYQLELAPAPAATSS